LSVFRCVETSLGAHPVSYPYLIGTGGFDDNFEHLLYKVGYRAWKLTRNTYCDLRGSQNPIYSDLCTCFQILL